MMDVGTNYSLLLIASIVCGLLYLYSLYNLYIGRKTRTYKYIALGFNFILLIGYIALLLNIYAYNNIPLVILLIILLAIIVLGIIGGFLYNSEFAINKEDEFEKQTRVFQWILLVVVITFGLNSSIVIGYELLTHSVSRVEEVHYVMDFPDCDNDIQFNDSNDASIFLLCSESAFNQEDIKQIELYFDEKLIYEDTNVLSSNFSQEFYQGFEYRFSYSFEDVLAYDQVDSIKLVIHLGEDTIIYNSQIYNKLIDYKNVTVPIWKK